MVCFPLCRGAQPTRSLAHLLHLCRGAQPTRSLAHLLHLCVTDWWDEIVQELLAGVVVGDAPVRQKLREPLQVVHAAAYHIYHAALRASAASETMPMLGKRKVLNAVLADPFPACILYTFVHCTRYCA